MEQYKEEFIHFMVESHVLKFGSFTLKSGRQSPFFMNAGAYVTGEQLHRLGKYYAQAIHDNFGLDFDVVFGPAYKGIPLAVVTAIALQELYGKEVRYCCNRKEVKDHGADKGNLLGADLHDGDRVIMVEDVTTSGKSIDETYPILKGAADVEVKGLIVSLNRMEVGKGGVVTAQKEVQEKYGFPVASIVSMAEVVECLYNKEVEGEVVINDDIKAAIDENAAANIDMELKLQPLMWAQNAVAKLIDVGVVVLSLVLYTGGRMELLNCVMLCVCSFLLTEGLEQAGTQSSLLRVVDTCVN